VAIITFIFVSGKTLSISLLYLPPPWEGGARGGGVTILLEGRNPFSWKISQSLFYLPLSTLVGGGARGGGGIACF